MTSLWNLLSKAASITSQKGDAHGVVLLARSWYQHRYHSMHDHYWVCEWFSSGSTQGRWKFSIISVSPKPELCRPLVKFSKFLVEMHVTKIIAMQYSLCCCCRNNQTVEMVNLTGAISLWSPAPRSCQKPVTMFKQALHHQVCMVLWNLSQTTSSHWGSIIMDILSWRITWNTQVSAPEGMYEVW